MRIKAGVHYVRNDTESGTTKTSGITTIEVHPTLNIALVQTGATFAMSDYIRTVCVLPKTGLTFLKVSSHKIFEPITL